MFNGILLIFGTCVGAGMIGLPIKTSVIGFFLKKILILLVWFL